MGCREAVASSSEADEQPWADGKVGRPDIDVFQIVMLREGENGRQRGFFVAFGYSCDAAQSARRFISERVESSNC